MTDTRTLTYLVAASVDGFIAGPDGDDPSGPDGFWPVTDDYVRFLAEEYPETLPGGAREALGITGRGSRFDPVERVRDLKREAGEGIWLVGGGTLAAALVSEIDELIVKLSPITTGAGIPLWGPEATFDLNVWTRAAVTPLPGGTTVLHFTRT